MTRYDRRAQALAACLSTLAGYVDGIAFLALGGFFVSFMSGNTTRLGVGLAEHGPHALLAGALILAFVTGVCAGSLTGRRAGERRWTAVLALVGAMLSGAALLGMAGWTIGAALLTAIAMGAENAVLERDGEIRVGLTYMTGALVRLGQGAAAAIAGEAPHGWLPYLLLWAGLAAGAALGALAWMRFGLAALWIGAAAAFLLALAAGRGEGGARLSP